MEDLEVEVAERVRGFWGGMGCDGFEEKTCIEGPTEEVVEGGRDGGEDDTEEEAEEEAESEEEEA